MEQKESRIYKKASFSERFFALAVDFLVVLAIIVSLRFLSSSILKTNYDQRVYGFIINPVIWILYSTLMLWKSGATVGKKFLGLKVVDSTYQPVHLGYALLRESLGKYLSGLFLSLGYLWVLLDKRKRAWHDKIAKTFVVKLDKTGAFIPFSQKEETETASILAFILLFILSSLLFYFTIFYLFIARP